VPVGGGGVGVVETGDAAADDGAVSTTTSSLYTTGIGTVDGSLVKNWNADAPTTGIAVDHFSLRAAGDIVFPAAGDYTLRVLADDGVRVWVGDAWTGYLRKTIKTMATGAKTTYAYYGDTETRWRARPRVAGRVPPAGRRPIVRTTRLR
jgi:hypothetical protein